MSQQTFLRLQHSESVVCEMSSRILAAFISSGQVTKENENEMIERSLSIAIKLAHKADRLIESDDETKE